MNALDGKLSPPRRGENSVAYRTIAVEARGTIEILSLARPEALNAISPEMAQELTDYIEGLHKRTDVRVVILRAEGRTFCAGLALGRQRPS